MGYLTLCEALTGGAFDGVNCQHRGAFDHFFGQMPRALPGEGGMSALGID